jgi:hypothetical protein
MNMARFQINYLLIKFHQVVLFTFLHYVAQYSGVHAGVFLSSLRWSKKPPVYKEAF